MRPLLDGLLTGTLLQLAVGPVFFFVFEITLNSGFLNGFSAVVGVTLADYLYITLSLLGVGQFLQKEKVRKVFGMLSALILIAIGGGFLLSGIRATVSPALNGGFSWNPWNSLTGAFLMTLASPLTLLFWTTVFSAKAIEKNYRQKELIGFGFGAGLSTLLFLSTAMGLLSLIGTRIPSLAVQILNSLVGLAILVYGIVRGVHSLKETANRKT